MWFFSFDFKVPELGGVASFELPRIDPIFSERLRVVFTRVSSGVVGDKVTESVPRETPVADWSIISQLIRANVRYPQWLYWWN
jgi:hypothetical protein